MDPATVKTIQDMMGQFLSGMEELKKLTPGTEDPANKPLACLQEAFSLFQTIVTKELEKVNERMTKMEDRQEKADQYSRRNCLLFRGLAETTKDDENSCMKTIMKVINEDLKLNLTEEVVERCHRLGRKKENDYNRPIIVKFYSYRYRREVFSAKKALAGKGIVITEFLTQQRMEVFLKAKEVHGSSNVWTSDGKILVKVGERRQVVTAVKDIPESDSPSTPITPANPTNSRKKPVVAKQPTKPLPTRSTSASGRGRTVNK